MGNCRSENGYSSATCCCTFLWVKGHHKPPNPSHTIHPFRQTLPFWTGRTDHTTLKEKQHLGRKIYMQHHRFLSFGDEVANTEQSKDEMGLIPRLRSKELDADFRRCIADLIRDGVFLNSTKMCLV